MKILYLIFFFFLQSTRYYRATRRFEKRCLCIRQSDTESWHTVYIAQYLDWYSVVTHTHTPLVADMRILLNGKKSSHPNRHTATKDGPGTLSTITQTLPGMKNRRHTGDQVQGCAVFRHRSPSVAFARSLPPSEFQTGSPPLG